MYSRLEFWLGKLPDLTKTLLRNAIAWDWLIQISKHELFNSFCWFLLLNISSVAADASFIWQQRFLWVASTQAGCLTATLHHTGERSCLGPQVGEQVSRQHPHKKSSKVAQEGLCHNFSLTLLKAGQIAVGLAPDLGDLWSAFCIDVISYSCWQVAKIKNGPQLPIWQCSSISSSLDWAFQRNTVRLRISSSPCYVSLWRSLMRLGLISKALCFMSLFNICS